MSAPAQDKRIDEIAAEYFGRSQPLRDIESAIRAALADPILTAAIREAALREAAKAAIEAVADCEGTIASQNFVAAAILELED